MTSRFDVDDYKRFERPGRGSRPRTKERPSYPDAVHAVVVTVDRGRYTCRIEGRTGQPVMAMKSRPLGRKGVVVGDRVSLVGDVSGVDGALARIVAVAPRTTVLRRTADDDDPIERVVVANAEQLVIVTALADPAPRTGLIDRCLVAAYDAGLDPLLCLTKADLAPAEPLLAIYRPLDVRYVVIERPVIGLRLEPLLADRVSVLVGHSGVGKSTLVNALVPGAARAIGKVNVVTGRGRHTSSSAIALSLPFGGWIVDTPGIRSFGLAHVQPRALIRAFPDLADVTTDCPRGCTHAAGQPECALDTAVKSGLVDAARVASYRRLLTSREGGGSATEAYA